MNKKKFFLNLFIYIFLITKNIKIKCSYKTTAPKNTESQKYNTNSPEIPSFPEDFNEDMIINMMQQTIEQYKNFSEEEKNAMCKDCNMSREDLDSFINEAKIELDKILITKETENKVISNEEPNKDNQASKTKKDALGYKPEIQNYINSIQKSINTMDLLHLKCQDETIRAEMLNQNNSILSTTEILNYYLKIFLEFLNKYSDENKINIDKKKIEEIISITDQINKIEGTIKRLVSFEEFNEKNDFDEIFKKYKIKPLSNEKLINFLEEEALKIENKIKEIKNDQLIDSKIKKTQIIDLEYKLNILEDDLSKIESFNIDEKKKQDKKVKKEFEINLFESIEKIINKFKTLFEKDDSLKKIENFIKEYFPKEYSIGKEKEKIQKEIQKKEQQILNQKGSRQEASTEKNINNSSYLQEKRPSSKQQENFQYQENENRDGYNEGNNEENPFNFPDPESINQSNKNSKENKENSQSINQAQKEDQTKEEDKKENKQTTRNIKKSQKKTTEKKKPEVNYTQEIFKEIEEINVEINSFISDFNIKYYDQKKYEEFINKIKEKTSKIKKNLEKIENQNISSTNYLDLLTLKDLDENAEKWPKNIAKEELLKIKILEEIKEHAKIPKNNFKDEPLEDLQIIFYKIKKLGEILNEKLKESLTKSEDRFKENIKKYIDNINESKVLETLNNTLPSQCKKIFLEKNILSSKDIDTIEQLKEKKTIQEKYFKLYNNEKKSIPYWTLDLNELEEDLKEIKKLEEKK